MQNDTYFVVFEKDNVRKYFEFDSQETFKKEYHSDWGTIIQEGISKKEAFLLCGADQKVIDCLNLSPWIYVVFEYTAEAGGYFKNRYFRAFRHTFEINHLLLNKVIIIAETFTQEAAICHLRVVPPVCLLVKAIEDAFVEPANIPHWLEMNLANACMAISSTYRESWTRAASDRLMDKHLHNHLKALAHPSIEDAKSAVIANLLLLYDFNNNRIYRFISETEFIVQMVDTCKLALKVKPIKRRS